MKNIYLDRYATPKHYFQDYGPDRDLKLIVVIPCHNEPDLLRSLESINSCDVDFPVEVITVINASETAIATIKEHNAKSYGDAIDWTRRNRRTNINHHFILENELPAKHAGVGLARKIGMDEAVRMFNSIENDDGIILCYDADCTCTSNLLSEVINHFEKFPKSPACSIHFEHPLVGIEGLDVYKGILNYELHLRFYINALKLADFPYAYQTIGSSMAVRSWAYQKQGGMNRRKAGEDFYFLHKIMPLENFTELNDAMVIPSPRVSNRVPFGTGKAVREWLENSETDYFTYAPDSFLDLKKFFSRIEKWQALDNKDFMIQEFSSLPDSIQQFITEDLFIKELHEINRQSTNLETYKKRFFQWWDGFKVLKYVHFCRDNFYPNVQLEQAIIWLFDQLEIEDDKNTLKSKLLELRKFDKG